MIDRAGRRPLLLCSSVCNALAMAAAGAFFFLRDALHQDDAAASTTWLPLASFVAFMISSNLGTTTVPWVMMGELLPQHHKTPVSTLTVLIVSVGRFATIKLLPAVGESLGLFVVFWAFGLWALVVFAFTMIMVPETRGKTLLQVQALLQGDSQLDPNRTPYKCQEDSETKPLCENTGAIQIRKYGR